MLLRQLRVLLASAKLTAAEGDSGSSPDKMTSVDAKWRKISRLSTVDDSQDLKKPQSFSIEEDDDEKGESINRHDQQTPAVLSCRLFIVFLYTELFASRPEVERALCEEGTRTISTFSPAQI